MIELLNHYIHFMSQGPQEFCVGCIVPGVFMMFTNPMPASARNTKPAPARRNAKRKAGKVAKVKPPKKAKVVNGGKVEAKETEPRETHKATPEEMLAADRYRAGRDRVAFDDNWN